MTTMLQNEIGWRGVLATDNSRTGDGRRFGEFSWRQTPLPLKYQPSQQPGHEGSVIVGRIDRIWKDNGVVYASGAIVLGSAAAEEARTLVETRQLRSVSVDPGGYEVDVTETPDGELEITFTSYTIGAATLVPVGAFAGAWVALDGMEDPRVDADEALAASGIPLDETGFPVLVAAGGPVGPPREWFADPGLTRRSGLHVTDEGRLSGHIYGWGECHTGTDRSCVRIPKGASYAYMTGVDGRGVRCADGSTVQTGTIVISADHAALNVGWLQAKDHYANTGLAVADVVCGEDDHGVWIAGAVRPGVTDEQLHVLRASAPSGDWRRIGGRLELVCVLMVNHPGFPALAASGGVLAHLEDGEVSALFATSRVAGSDCGCGGHEALDEALARLSALEAQVAPFRAQRAREAEALAVELGVDRESRAAAILADILP